MVLVLVLRPRVKILVLVLVSRQKCLLENKSKTWFSGSAMKNINILLYSKADF